MALLVCCVREVAQVASREQDGNSQRKSREKPPPKGKPAPLINGLKLRPPAANPEPQSSRCGLLLSPQPHERFPRARIEAQTAAGTGLGAGAVPRACHSPATLRC